MHIVAMAMGSDEAAILECMQAGVAQQKVFCWVYRAVLYVRVRGFMKHYWQETANKHTHTHKKNNQPTKQKKLTYVGYAKITLKENHQ